MWISKHGPQQVLRELRHKSSPHTHHCMPPMWRSNAKHHEVLRELWIRLEPWISDMYTMRENQPRRYKILWKLRHKTLTLEGTYKPPVVSIKAADTWLALTEKRRHIASLPLLLLIARALAKRDYLRTTCQIIWTSPYFCKKSSDVYICLHALCKW